jgi:hypothetical protein
MNTKRTFMKSILALVAGLSFTQSKGNPMHIVDGFVHVVYFWLKHPENDEHKSRFLKSVTNYLNKIDVIKSKFVGKPAATNRDVIDSSYTFSLVTTFQNRNDQDIYQEHPAHLKFIEDSSELWEKVVVYDSLPA